MTTPVPARLPQQKPETAPLRPRRPMTAPYCWLGTAGDNALVAEWLKRSGAVPLYGSLDVIDYSRPTTLSLHFPAAGPAIFLSSKADRRRRSEAFSQQRHAGLAKRGHGTDAVILAIDADRSAVAVLDAPYKRSCAFWTTGELHFLGAELEGTAPALRRICRGFGTWLRRQKPVFDSTAKLPCSPLAEQLGRFGGFVEKVYAMPEALRLLKAGALMVARRMTDRAFKAFIDELKLKGVDLPPAVKAGISTDRLFELARDGRLAGLKALIARAPGAARITDGNGHTLLHRAAANDQAGVVDFLLGLGLDADCRDKHKQTPLHHAASLDAGAAMTRLLKGGADPNLRSDQGTTPLHEAVMAASPQNVRLLVTGGGDPRMRDGQGRSASDLAPDAEIAAVLQDWPRRH